MGTEPNHKGCITLGPWGSSTGESWTCIPKGVINKITIIHGTIIFCIKFQSEDYSTGETKIFSFGRNPGSRISKSDTICIDYDNEYLTSISGTFGNCYDYVFVKSLSFDTTKKHYGPFGVNAGTSFSFDGKGGVIVGFHGRADPNGLNAVGIFVMPESLAFCEDSTTTSKQSSMHELCSSCMSGMVPPRGAGPWGATAGEQWDDGVFSAIKQVHIFIDESSKVLRAIQFLYVKRDGKLMLSSTHGGTCGHKMELLAVVNLDGRDEYLTQISGFYGPIEGYKGLEAIWSITFHTNKTIHGPYGSEGSGEGHTCFASTESSGKVVGFHGRKRNGLITAIGVHMEYF